MGKMCLLNICLLIALLDFGKSAHQIILQKSEKQEVKLKQM